MSRFLIHAERSVQGWVDVVPPADDRLAHLAFAMIGLRTGESFAGTTGGREHLAVLIHGSMDVQCGGKAWRGLGRRESVFDDRAHAVYMPPGHEFEISAHEELLLAVPSSPAERKGEPFAVLPDETVHHRRGGAGFLRDVHDIVGSSHPTQRLLVGETVNLPGNWSSFPPHKHDQHVPGEEAKLEEVYFYQIDPKSGFAFQRLYTEQGDVDESVAVRDGDVFLIPRGYHPVAAPPGHRVYYLWALAGEEHELRHRTDPAYTRVDSLKHALASSAAGSAGDNET